MSNADNLARKLEALSDEQLARVEGFVDALTSQSDQESMITAAAALSEHAFERIWKNPEDDIYGPLISAM